MKIAILYHHTDENYADDLRKHLELLKGQAPELVIWSYKESDLGEWQEELNAQLKDANQVVFLLSVDGMTDVILCGGVTYARQQNIVVSPVLVRACGYENSDLVNNLSILPVNKVSVNQATDADHVWATIAYRLVTNMGFALVPMTKPLKTETGVKTLPKELTVRLPRQNLEDIIGRRETLKELRQRLSSEKQVVLVNGMGGIGKTTLATVYVAEYYEQYEHIAWVTQLGEDVVASFVQTEGLLKQFAINPSGLKPQEVFMALMNGFKGIKAQPCLLVIDNALPSLEEYVAYLPSQPHWHVLVTARERIEGFSMLQLDFLDNDEAIALFKKHYTLEKLSVAFIAELVDTLDYHTLTIEILAKTAQRSRTSPEKLLVALKNDLKTKVYTPHSGKKIERVLSYLCSIFEQQALNEMEAHILVQCVCLPAEWHDYELLEELLDAPEGELAEILNDLAERGLLLYNIVTDQYKLHRIIAEVVVKTVGVTLEQVSYLVAVLTEKLSIDQTKDNPVDKFVWTPFGGALLAHFEEAKDPDIARLQNNLALVLQDLGNYSGAKSLLEKAMHSAEQNFGESHPTTAVSYSNLALVLQDLGDYSGAKSLLEEAMHSAEQNFGESHPTTAVSYSNLAMVLYDLGELPKAVVLLEKAHLVYHNHLGPDHPTTKIIKGNLDYVRSQLG